MVATASMRLALVALMTLLLTMVAARPTPRSPPPLKDPFYDPPDGFESKEPGAILRQRKVTSALFGFIPNPVETHQLLYRTTAIDGSAIATVTTIFKPWFPMEDRFVSFHTAYDSSAPKCDPSYSYQLGNDQTDLIASVENLIIEVYLLKGYIVASPDYEGPDAAFGAGHIEGMGVLDNMRAVNNYKESLGIKSDNPMIAGVGYSGGAIATGWAAGLQPNYAPELNMKGWVQGGTPANLTGTLLYIDDTLFSGFIPAAIDGLLKPSAYGAQLGPLVDQIATDKGKAALQYASTHCAVGDLINFPEKSVLTTEFQSLGPALLYQSTVASVLAQNIMGVQKSETPTAPVFVYHATQDEIIPYANASTLVDSWCGYGADVKFTTFANGGHATTEIVALPDAVSFVEAAFDGSTPAKCTTNTELKNSLNPFALGVELEPVLVALINALAQLGDMDQNVKQDVNVLAEPVKTGK